MYYANHYKPCSLVFRLILFKSFPLTVSAKWRASWSFEKLRPAIHSYKLKYVRERERERDGETKNLHQLQRCEKMAVALDIQKYCIVLAPKLIPFSKIEIILLCTSTCT